ncbi:MAG: hypothetical protein JJU31_15380 [Wenzhouxiangella sp.]|nr:hypothetical protein [Wenzhouxiangella sp.]
MAQPTPRRLNTSSTAAKREDQVGKVVLEGLGVGQGQNTGAPEASRTGRRHFSLCILRLSGRFSRRDQA